MSFSNFLKFICFGFLIATLELFFHNFMPILGVIDLTLIFAVVFLLSEKSYSAIVFGSASFYIRDILSGDVFGIHLITFIAVTFFLIILYFFIFTNKSLVAYIIFGSLSFFIYKILDTTSVAISSPEISFLGLSIAFPSLLISMVVNASILVFYWYIRFKREEHSSLGWITNLQKK